MTTSSAGALSAPILSPEGTIPLDLIPRHRRVAERAGSEDRDAHRSRARPGTVRLWDAAARSIAMAEGLAETVAEVLHARALRHFGDGVVQYLAIRMRSASLAGDVFREVRAEFEGAEVDELVAQPGVRARLYKLARDIVRKRTRATVGNATIPWRSVAAGAPPKYARALARLRMELSPDDAEVLELVHARELDEREAAFVLDLNELELGIRLDTAEERARRIVGDDPPSALGGFAGAIAEAFALDCSVLTYDREGTGRPAPLATGAVIADRYRIERRVGGGAFGDVYRAEDAEVPGHVVALKLLHRASPSNASRGLALRELRHIASVFHPSIVLFKDHGWFEDRLWFVMPWYEGETLDARLERGPLARDEARQIFEPLARALEVMHAAGLRHQDIKPENIFLAKIQGATGGVLPVLLDLGVAAKEAEMVFAGTPTYFAPEVAAQFCSTGMRRAITARADVFSLALTLRNALEPETREEVVGSAIEKFVERRAGRAPDPPANRAFRDLGSGFRRWLHVDPLMRPIARELAEELASLTAPAEKRRRRGQTLRWLLPLAVGALSIFGAVTWALSHEARSRATEAAHARANYLAADARTRRLETGIEALHHEVESSRMTRVELASELDRTRGALSAARRDATDARERAAALEPELARIRGERDEMNAALARTNAALGAEQARVNDLSRDVSRARESMQDLEARLVQMRATTTGLVAQLEDARARSTELAHELEEERAASARDRSRLAEREARVAELEAMRARLLLQLDEAQPPATPARSPRGRRRGEQAEPTEHPRDLSESGASSDL